MRLVQQQTASPAGASGRSASSTSARVAAALPACVVRGRPFTAISKQAGSKSAAAAKRSVLPALRAAAVDEAPGAAAADDEDADFTFNYSDSKKANEYSTSDVDSAIRFYVDGEGLAPEADGEFVTNNFGSEDAGFFDDIDNNEAYEADEFSVAGIPEAAPKKRGMRRKDGAAGGAEEEDDDFNKAREQGRFKAMEDAMVAAAQMEEMGFDKQETEQRTVVGPPVWDWMQDFDATEGRINSADQLEADDALAALASAPMRTVSTAAASQLPSDDALFTDMRAGVVEELDQDSKDLLEFLVDDFDLEGELKRVDDSSTTLEVPESSEDDLADARALLDADISLPPLDDSLLAVDEGLELAGEDDGSAPLTPSDVESYLTSLRATEGGELTDEESAALFAGDGGADSGEVMRVNLSAIEEDPEAGGDDSLLSTAKAAASEAEGAVTAVAPEEVEVTALAEEQDDDDLADTYSAELASLRASMNSQQEIISDAELDICEQFLTMGETFLDAEEQRRAGLAQAVAKGTLNESVLDEEFEEAADVESELLTPQEWEGADVEASAFDDDADGEAWVERIIDLTRVTKVVKGGKLMGFRCTAVVGNQNGLVGVGCAAGREVATAVKRALVDAKKSVVEVPLVGAGTLPHRMEAKFHSARMVVLPASEGTGCIAGGSIRSVLELAGVKDCLAKRLGCRSPLNNARCTVKALQQMKTLNEVSAARGVPMSRLLLPRSA